MLGTLCLFSVETKKEKEQEAEEELQRFHEDGIDDLNVALNRAY